MIIFDIYIPASRRFFLKDVKLVCLDFGNVKKCAFRAGWLLLKSMYIAKQFFIINMM